MRAKKGLFVAVVLIGGVFLIHHFFATNEFYEDTSEDFGLCKVPLIEPYGLLSQTCKGNWYLNFDFSIGNNYVDSVAVVDSLIIWNNISGTQARGKTNKYFWFILNVQNKKCMFFETKNDLEFYLKQSAKEEIKFYAVHDAWNNYWDHGKKWIMLQGGAEKFDDSKWYK